MLMRPEEASRRGFIGKRRGYRTCEKVVPWDLHRQHPGRAIALIVLIPCLTKRWFRSGLLCGVRGVFRKQQSITGIALSPGSKDGYNLFIDRAQPWACQKKFKTGCHLSIQPSRGCGEPAVSPKWDMRMVCRQWYILRMERDSSRVLTVTLLVFGIQRPAIYSLTQPEFWLGELGSILLRWATNHLWV